jgi:sulfopyruvate decarboxylase TPP-binding subunit
VLDTLISLGATHVLGIPDNGSARLFDLASSDDRLTLLTVTREGEAFAVASGLWVGGAAPVVVIQGTGLLESGDSVRGTAIRMGAPMLCLIGYRGYGKMLGAGIDAGSGPYPPETLRRADVDSAALFLEPTLDAWGIPYDVLIPERATEMIESAWARAQAEERPVALLLTSALA